MSPTNQARPLGDLAESEALCGVSEMPDSNHGQPASRGRPDLRTVQAIGGLLILAQGFCMLAWSYTLWHRFALTYDYSIYNQAWWLIGHGHLNPYSSVLHYPFYRNNFELIMWPLAAIGLMWSHGPVLPWIQDACLVIAELVAWRWMCGSLGGWATRWTAPMAIAGLVLLVANPWTWWAISFDVHMEVIALPFVLLLVYDLSHDRPRAWIWVPLILACGNPEATYVAGIGLGAMLAGRRRRARGAGLVMIGVSWVALSTAVHTNGNATLAATYGYLARARLAPTTGTATLVRRIVAHPGGALSALWAHRLDIWANLAPGGLIGLASPWALGLSLPVLLANELTKGFNFSNPGDQNVPLYIAVPLGTVLVLEKLRRRRPRLALGLAAAAAVNAAAWAAVWGPSVPHQWLRISPGAAAALGKAREMIPASAEVVASQGIAGRFSDRAWLYPILSPAQVIPVHDTQIWWVVAPAQGVETDPVTVASSLLGQLAGAMHARLALHGHGVWVFEWIAPPGVHRVVLPGVPAAPPWSFPGPAGVPVVTGPPSTWHLAANGRRGYVMAHDYWTEPAGFYTANLTLSTTAPVEVEVWNATGAALLARKIIATTAGLETVHVTVDANHYYPHHDARGFGPFRAQFPPPPRADEIEIRVWSFGAATVDVVHAALLRAP